MARTIGIDPGVKRCGIAISDSDHTMAFPRPALANDDQLMDTLRALIDDEGATTIVVGRPVALSGNETASTLSADQLYQRLIEAFGDLDVIQWDERLTTYEAQRSLAQAGIRAKAQREHIDSAAAVIMLQNYVDGLSAD
ncbi:MAG TPA: Holliday junction resolvase RuvX [Acidimicrobiales bacterium]|jgi:putative holliday junction resolvase|nr:Holliday junction resolvase RuvX [Acidimicrobiales bacterium]